MQAAPGTPALDRDGVPSGVPVPRWPMPPHDICRWGCGGLIWQELTTCREGVNRRRVWCLAKTSSLRSSSCLI
eukprot:3197264-Prymnesium_polylepis.2